MDFFLRAVTERLQKDVSEDSNILQWKLLCICEHEHTWSGLMLNPWRSIFPTQTGRGSPGSQAEIFHATFYLALLGGCIRDWAWGLLGIFHLLMTSFDSCTWICTKIYIFVFKVPQDFFCVCFGCIRLTWLLPSQLFTGKTAWKMMS